MKAPTPPAFAVLITAMARPYPHPQAALLPILHQVQRLDGGYVSKARIAEIAHILHLPVSTVFGVQSYYSMFNLAPVGRWHLQVDTNIPAMLAGADALLAHLETTLGIHVGETTADGLFTLSTVEDLGACGTCPVIQVNDRTYENMTPAKADELLHSLRQGVMPEQTSPGHWSSACNILLKRRGLPAGHTLATYRATGGYQALEKALSMSPEAVTAEVKASFMRGRGGAGFPTGVKWGFLPKGNGKPTYLVCNADEGEPGTFKDRQIMEADPHLLMEGMAIAAWAIGAALGFIYIRGEFSRIAHILEEACDEARAAGMLGPDAFGPGKAFDIIVHLGAGSYVCGEETALIESLEGKRGNPRLKPPFPATAGLWGCPTIVNNVETLALVPTIIEHGAGAFRRMGTTQNYGPKIFGVSGHVQRPGTYEFPLGTPLETVLEAAGGVKGKLKAIIVGGLSVPILTADEAAGLCLSYDACRDRGTMLGSGGIIVMNESTSIPRVALRAMRFYAHESCGQCVPCRQGSHALTVLLERMVAGQGKLADLDAALALCQTIKGTTLCPTGDAFALPIEAMLVRFRAEFEALVG